MEERWSEGEQEWQKGGDKESEEVEKGKRGEKG